MKFLVCISVVPDTTTKVTFKDNNTQLNTAGVNFIINPYDEFSLAKAIELKNQSVGIHADGSGTITIINVGLADTEANIRKALAIGADDAIRVNAHPENALFVAQQIANVAKEMKPDIIFTGKESTDYNGGMMAGLIGELLDIPSVTIAVSMKIENNKATIEREIEGGKEIVESSLPLVISAQRGLGEPIIPNMRGIMTARTKPLKVVEPVAVTSSAKYSQYKLPEAKQGGKILKAESGNAIEELLKLLKDEAKII